MKRIFFLFSLVISLQSYGQYHAGIGVAATNKAPIATMETGWLFARPLIIVQGEMRIHISNRDPVYVGGSAGKGFLVTDDNFFLVNAGYYFALKSSDRPWENKWCWGAGIAYWKPHTKFFVFYQNSTIQAGITLYGVVSQYR